MLDIFFIMQAVEDAASGKISDTDKQVVKDKCASEMAWLDSNTLADKEEFEHHLKELQRVCSPIMSKMHGQGSQGEGQGGNPGGKGPTVEEVD